MNKSKQVELFKHSMDEEFKKTLNSLLEYKISLYKRNEPVEVLMKKNGNIEHVYHKKIRDEAKKTDRAISKLCKLYGYDGISKQSLSFEKE